MPAGQHPRGAERRAYWAVLAVTCWALVLTLRFIDYAPPDWWVISRAGELLLMGNLDVYARVPEAQVGPLVLVLAGALPRTGFIALVIALLPMLLVLLVRARPPVSYLPILLLIGGVPLAFPWSLYALEGHADEALVCVGAALMATGAHQRRDRRVATGFVLAMAAKPTAILLVPLLVRCSSRTRWIAVACVCVVWIPFVIADPLGFLQAGGGIAEVQPHSLPNLLGVEEGAGFPAWVRPVQLAAGLLAGVMALRVGPFGMIAAVFATRAALEPGAWPAYSAAVIVGCLYAEGWRNRAPLLLLGLAFGSWWLSLGLATPVAGIVRLLALAGVVASAVLPWGWHVGTRIRPVESPR